MGAAPGACEKGVRDSPSDEVLQDGALSSGLSAHHRDLGQIQRHVDPQLSKSVLQLIHDGNKLLHP
jgi:hypothetical protein